MSRENITRNFLDSPSYWRDYPDRDIEFVRWYPCDVGPLNGEQLFRERESPRADVSFYIHVPFCNQVCTSCPYNKFNTRNTLVGRYLQALKAEIDTYAALPYFRDAELSSGYLGGGTPTTLRASELDELLGHLRARLPFKERCSITVESTPVDIDERKVEVLLKHGVDRVSLGVQTFHDPLLRHLGRAGSHTGARARETIRMLHREGISNICVDYMIGIPGQTMALWQADVRTLMEEPIGSFSVYNYMVMPGSEAFFGIQSGAVPPCPPSQEADQMYWYFIDEVLSNGYVAVTYNDFFGPMTPAWQARGASTYPIRNLRNGKEYRGLESGSFYLTHHLAHIWQRCGDSLALGSGAYGFLNHHLYLNEPNIERYIELAGSGRLSVAMGSYADEHERRCRSLVLGLKLLRVRRDDFRRAHGVDLYAVFPGQIDDLRDKGLLDLTDEALEVTCPKGWFYIDNICKAFYSKRNHRLPQPSSASTEILKWRLARLDDRRGQTHA